MKDVEYFKKGTWYKEYSQSKEPNKVIHLFVDCFVRDMTRYSLEKVFFQYCDEAKRISSLVRPVIAGKQLSPKWFEVLFCELVLTVAKERGAEVSMLSKLHKMFALVDDAIEKYYPLVVKSHEYLCPVFFGKESIEILCVALDPFKTGRAYKSKRGLRWMVLWYDLGVEVSIVRMVNESGRKKSFRDSDVLKMERIFE